MLRPGFDDGLPYEFHNLLTAKGLAYAQEPGNLLRLWRMHAGTFKPAPFDGTCTWARSTETESSSTEIHVNVTAPGVTVLVAHRKKAAHTSRAV
jgi:hypothetical protein